MNPIDTYIEQVLSRVPPLPDLRTRIREDLRTHLQDAVNTGTPVEHAIASMGTPDEVAAGYAAVTQYVYPSIWRRIGAYLIDIGVTVTSWIVLVLLIAATLGINISRDMLLEVEQIPVAYVAVITVLVVLMYLAGLFYPPVAEWKTGTTIGKWCFGLTVIRTDGRPMNLLRAIGRHLPWIITFPSMGLITLEALWAFTNPKKQRACDVLADTVVIQRNQHIAVERILLGMVVLGIIIFSLIWIIWKTFGPLVSEQNTSGWV